MQRIALSLFAMSTLSATLSTVACAPSTECGHLTDCPGALVCSSDGQCVDSDAPVFLGGVGGGVGLVRADPSDPLSSFSTDAGFAGVIDGNEFSTSTPQVEGTSDGYVAWQLTTEVPGGVAGMWFDIPMPALLPVGEPRTFTLEEMYADGTIPCISLWGPDGAQTWADDYVMTQHPEDDEGNVVLEIEASNDDAVATAILTVPALQ